MILIFDLDDTLYDERSYVESGLRAVARWGQEKFGWDQAISLRFMVDVLESEGRGQIFDRWLDSHGIKRRGLIADCVNHYRHHEPAINLPDSHHAILNRLGQQYPLYLVTDGHKVVQEKKVQALKIRPFFRRILITHRFGIANAKPSRYCFELIRKAEQCDWAEMVYIGDNPAKDFVNLNVVRMPTVRVLTGVHSEVVGGRGYEAAHHIPDLSNLEPLVGSILVPGHNE